MLKEIKGDVHIYLMYLGTLPFIIFSLSIITNYKSNFIMINRPAESIKLYALIISIFMAGIQWGLCLQNSYKLLPSMQALLDGVCPLIIYLFTLTSSSIVIFLAVFYCSSNSLQVK